MMILEAAMLHVKSGHESDFEEAFQRASTLLHHFYKPFPIVEHFEQII